ncbi:Nuclear transport factor 2 (NTF2) domain [Trypanosoma vivax]|uniref:NTF2 domain-containing protein n=1 Tax=Trypanosoma vivax (strain Y486) TaxID=1055687 RepID=G0U5M2_TRYVY|nr:Nuclear transport factor 2 (NTF2) domain [Trypanosoma vivax]CCC51173.1 conserved hypothetical protein [Trypanosoma vivax Y486]
MQGRDPVAGVACSFIVWYYREFVKEGDFVGLLDLYAETSQVIYAEYNETMPLVAKGRQDIAQHLAKMDAALGRRKVEVRFADFFPVPLGCIQVVAQGILYLRGQKRVFCQTFVLVPTPHRSNTYHVASDYFRVLLVEVEHIPEGGIIMTPAEVAQHLLEEHKRCKREEESRERLQLLQQQQRAALEAMRQQEEEEEEVRRDAWLQPPREHEGYYVRGSNNRMVVNSDSSPEKHGDGDWNNNAANYGNNVSRFSERNGNSGPADSGSNAVVNWDKTRRGGNRREERGQARRRGGREGDRNERKDANGQGNLGERTGGEGRGGRGGRGERDVRKEVSEGDVRNEEVAERAARNVGGRPEQRERQVDERDGEGPGPRQRHDHQGGRHSERQDNHKRTGGSFPKDRDDVKDAVDSGRHGHRPARSSRQRGRDHERNDPNATPTSKPYPEKEGKNDGNNKSSAETRNRPLPRSEVNKRKHMGNDAGDVVNRGEETPVKDVSGPAQKDKATGEGRRAQQDAKRNGATNQIRLVRAIPIASINDVYAAIRALTGSEPVNVRVFNNFDIVVKLHNVDEAKKLAENDVVIKGSSIQVKIFYP